MDPNHAVRMAVVRTFRLDSGAVVPRKAGVMFTEIANGQWGAMFRSGAMRYTLALSEVLTFLQDADRAIKYGRPEALRGVYRHSGGWQARVYRDRRLHVVGTFDTPEAAQAARQSVLEAHKAGVLFG